MRVISPPARAAARPAADAFYGGLSSLPVQQRSPLLLMALFGGYGVWWLLGIGAFVWPLFALLMALSLLRTPRVEVPPGSGLWVLFVLWTLASGVAISSSSDGLTFAFRVITYVSAGVIVLYVLNLPRRRDVTRSIVHALMAFWVVIVIGGYLGILVPHLSFPSVFERLLPGVVSRSGFLQQLVHPQLAQRQTWLRHARPSAPFPFSNMWGGTVGVLLPFVFLELRWARTTLRRVLIGALLVAAVLPIVRTADRGLWVSLGVAVAYVAIRRAVKGRVGLLVMLLLVAGIAGVALLADRSALAPVASQFDRSSSNEARQYLAQQSLTQALHHPWLGTGVPIRPPGRNIPYIGTQGQGWLVLVTSGFPALLLFLGWFGFAFWRSRRLDGELAFAAHVSLLVFFVHLPIYDMLPSELIVAMVACALVFRDPSSRLVRAVAVPRSPPPARPRLAGAPVGEPRRLAEPPDTPAGAAQRAGSFFVGARARPASDAERSGAATRLNTLARHSAMNLAGNVISAVLGFVLVLVVARGLGARGAGVFFEAVALFTVTVSVTLLGADVGLIRQLARARAMGLEGDLRTLLRVSLWPVFGAGIAAAIAVYGFAPQLAGILVHGANAGGAVRFIRVLAPFLPLAAVSTAALGATRGLGSMTPYNLVENLGKPLARPLLILAAIAMGLSGAWVALGWALPVVGGLAATLFVLFVMLRRATLSGAAQASGVTASTASTGRVAREFWSFAAPRWAGAVFQIALIWLDVLLVGAMRSTAEAGVYATASRFITAGTFALQAVGFAIAPQIGSLLARGERMASERLYQVATWWLVIVSWPLYLTLGIFAPLVLGVFGRGFGTGAGAMTILAVATLVNVGTGNVTFVLLMAGKSWWNLANQGAALAVNVGLNLLLIPKLGISGAALAWGAAILVENGLPLIQVRRHLGLHPFGRGYLLVTGAAVACYALPGIALRWAFGPGLAGLTATLVAGTAAYAMVLWRNRDTLELPALVAALSQGHAGHSGGR